MPISVYRLTIPVFHRGIDRLSHYLDRIEAHAEETRVETVAIINARLAEDMLPLVGQYQRATDTAKFAVGRVAEVQMPRFEDDESSVAELRERLAKPVQFLGTVRSEALDDMADREVSVRFGNIERIMLSQDYLLKFALPNFYFHVTTAHNILRNQGLTIGKFDYFGPFD